MEKLTLHELYERKDWSKAIVVFTKDSFSKRKEWSLEERSYKISRESNYFDSNKISTSLFGNCLDGKDDGVRLDWYISGYGDRDIWEIEYCYIVE